MIANNPDVASLTVVEINPGYMSLIAAGARGRLGADQPQGQDRHRRRPPLAARSIRSARFDAIVSNTTWHFRANATNLLSAEFLDLVRRHLKPGGIFFYNTTDSDRVQRTGCLEFPHGARFTNHMVVSAVADRLGFRGAGGARWKPIASMASRCSTCRAPKTAQVLDAPDGNGRQASRPATLMRTDGRSSPARDILARTAGQRSVTDDNMGTEWRYFLGLE